MTPSSSRVVLDQADLLLLREEPELIAIRLTRKRLWTPCVIRWGLFAVLASTSALVVSAASAASAASPRLPGHPLLVDRPELRVYGPWDRARVQCPRLLPLPVDSLATVEHAVELAMPPFERKLKLDGRDPIVKVAPARRSGYDYRAGGCGRTAWTRSIVASVLLPHIEKFSASMSQHTFAVGRVRQGWVLWGWIH